MCIGEVTSCRRYAALLEGFIEGGGGDFGVSLGSRRSSGMASDTDDGVTPINAGGGKMCSSTDLSFCVTLVSHYQRGMHSVIHYISFSLIWKRH